MATANEKAIAELRSCHDQIREGTFRRNLLAKVQKHSRSWRDGAKPLDRLQGAVVASEIYDYYGKYVKAQEALCDYDLNDTLHYVEESARKRRPTFKRELWVVLSHAQTLYRAEDYPEVRRVLGECTHLLNLVDPNEAGYFGTRSRLLYLSGQVLRQQGAHDEARRQFGESIEFACRRLRQKTPFFEFVAPEEYASSNLSEEEKTTRLRHAQKLAHWTIARSLALGIAWIYYVTGRLSDASRALAVGTVLFRSTGDSINRAYCDLLVGAVSRARYAHKRGELSAALRTMTDASKGVRGNPLFELRAHYEIVLAHLHADDVEQARTTITSLESSLTAAQQAVGSRLERWSCQLLVLKSRLFRKERAFDKAAELAKKAADLANSIEQSSLAAEAFIAWAEAEHEVGTAAALESAVAHLAQARQLGEGNPKTSAVCCLHSALVHIKQQQPDAARDEFKRWDHEYRAVVEHGFVKQLADRVNISLWSSDGELRLVGMRYDENKRRLKEALLRKVLAIPGLSRPEQAKRIGLKNEKDFVRWVRECGLESELRRRSRQH